MWSLLIGSSNVYRFHKLLETRRDQKHYKLICCTNLEVWNTTIDDIKMDKGEIIVSIIENLICDAVVEVPDPEARTIIIEDVVGSFLEQIRRCALKRPEVKFALFQPTLRPKHQWYTDGHEALCKSFLKKIKEMKLHNVARVDGSPGWSQIFVNDGVHLTEAAGKVFVETIILDAEAFFSQEIIDVEEDGKKNPQTKEANQIASRIDTIEKEIGKLNRELQEQNKDIHERRLHDSLVTARIREEIDFIANMKKEDKIIITGLTSKIPMPTQSEEKRNG